MSDEELVERLRAAIPEESTVDQEEHLDAVLAVVEKAKALRELPTDQLFAAVRERSRA